MTGNYLHIIGLGVAEFAELSSSASHALKNADVIIGAGRQLAVIERWLTSGNHRCIALPRLSELKALIAQHSGKSIAVLASGDPLYYGIGRWFSKNFSLESLQFYPAVSSIQAACHRLGIALQDVTVVSLHGRPIESLRRALKRQQRLLILTDQYSQPQHLAQECIDAGFSESIVTVCENLGYRKEKITRFFVSALANQQHHFDSLHVSYIEVLGQGGVMPEFPGIPDHHFATDAEPGKGMISKREVRLVILSMMQTAKDDVVWDIGAGCGGVSVEMALWQAQAQVYAIEFHRERLRYLHENCKKFGVVKNLNIVDGRAPEVLVRLPAPSKVFIGGSNGELEALLVKVWQLLPINGVLVASGVMDKTKQQLRQFGQSVLPEQVESVEVNVKRGKLHSGEIQYATKLPIEIFKFTKSLDGI